MSGAAFAHSVVEPSRWSKRVAGTLVVAYALLTMIPLVWIFATALKSGPDSIAYPPKWVFDPSSEGFCNLFNTRSRQSEDYIAKLPPSSGVCDSLARRSNMVLVGPSNFQPSRVSSIR